MVTIDVYNKDDTDRLYFKCAKCGQFIPLSNIHEIKWHTRRLAGWYCGGCYSEIRKASGAND